MAARRQGRELRSAHACYERIGRDLAGVKDEIAAARSAESKAADHLQAVAGELAELGAVREELAGRPELASLDHAERLATATAETAAKEKASQTSAERARGERAVSHESALGAASRTRELVADTATAAGQAAALAGIERDHARLTAPLGLPDSISEELISSLEQQFAVLAARREEALAHVLALAEAAAAQEAEAAAARGRLAELEGERDAAADARQAAEDCVAAAGAALVEAWQAYAAGVRELVLPYPDETGLADWATSLHGQNPAEAALRSAATRATQALAAAHAQASARAAETAGMLESLEVERRRLEAGESAVPPVPYTRGEGIRNRRPGAPLWQLTDFDDDLPEEQRAGLEAALEASGLLDAWVTPEGTLLDPDTHDVVVTAGTPAERSLAATLCPSIDATDPMASLVAPETVGAVLAAIGLMPASRETADGGAAVRVNTSGRWQIGQLHGASAKPAAEYVGAGTREQARRRRLAALEQEITGARDAVAAAVRAVAGIEARQSALDGEVAGQPSDQDLRDAHGKAAGAREALGRATGKVGEQATRVTEAERKSAEAAAETDEAAADLGVPTSHPELRAAAAVTDYTGATQRLATALWKHHAKLSETATCAAELAKAERELAAVMEDSRKAAELARDAAARLRALRETIGASADELRQRLEATKRRITELDAAHESLEAEHREQFEKRARLQGREEQLLSSLAEETARRDGAVAAFWRFAATGLLAVAVPEVEPPGSGQPPGAAQPVAADPAVRLARRGEQALTFVDDSDDAWKRVQDDIGRRHAELAEALSRHGHHAALNLVDERVVVTIQFHGKDRAPDELTDLLNDEIGYRERMLTAKERELIEEHLVNDVASHLQELISDAEAQVGLMNAELAERPTSTGMRLRLRWEPSPEGPPGLAEARRRLLRQDAELWSPADRAAVGEFLQRQIEAERAKAEDSTWQEQLRRALDYRVLHRFVIERLQDGRWRPATGPASGGERVLAVSLPLFAAASAHYRSAHPDAPRLVLLDEAFAGVDDDARAKCLGLLATFDLDVVMTSEREWGFYATVPGIATHHLVRRDGIDAVYVTTWEWDGKAQHRIERGFAARQPTLERSGAANGRDALGGDTPLW